MTSQTQCFDGPDSGTIELPAQIRLLMHAAIILLALNAIIALWFYISPNTRTAFAAPAAEVSISNDTSSYKASPFESVVVEKAPKGVKRPPKAEPYFAEVVSFESRSATPLNAN